VGDWKKIKEYPEYYISNIGQVWSKKTSKILALSQIFYYFLMPLRFKNTTFLI
jgi:hypothetical protein